MASGNETCLIFLLDQKILTDFVRSCITIWLISSLIDLDSTEQVNTKCITSKAAESNQVK